MNQPFACTNSAENLANRTLIDGMAHLYVSAIAGDQEARAALRGISARATEGDKTAEAALNTLAVIHYNHFHKEEWKEAAREHSLLQNKDPKAVAWVTVLQKQAKQGDVKSRRKIGMLNAHKNMYERSAWAPTQTVGLDENVRVRNHSPSNYLVSNPPAPTPAVLTSTSLASANNITPRNSSMIMLPGKSGQRPNRTRRFASVGADPAPKAYPPVTPQVEQQLIAMMLRGAKQTVALSSSSLNPQSAAEMKKAAAAAAANNSEVTALRATHTDPNWLRGFDVGSMVAYQKSASGPGQDAFRDGLINESYVAAAASGSLSAAEVVTSLQAMGIQPSPEMLAAAATSRSGATGYKGTDAAINQKLAGFDAARAQQYALTLAGKNVPLPSYILNVVLPGAVVRAVGRVRTGPAVSAADFAARQADQQYMCMQAASAKARNSPAAPGLAQSCLVQRIDNIKHGIYLPDNFSPDDPTYRVALTDAGEVVVAANPKMLAFRNSLPASRQRGFTIAMGARAGNMDAGWPAFVMPAFSHDAEFRQGFLDGMKM